jgi:hypothetical protein
VPERELLPVVETPIACSLSAPDLTTRLDEWRRALSSVRATRHASPGQIAVELGAGVDVAELARLCAAEVACCPFFTFELVLEARGAQLRIRVPDDAHAVLADFARLLPTRQGATRPSQDQRGIALPTGTTTVSSE